MIITKENLESWSGRKFVYRSKSLLLSADLKFSYELDEDRFLAASSIEVKSLGKIIFEEQRSSRHFSVPRPRWSDFILNGKIITAEPGAFDLCLIPMVFNINVSTIGLRTYINEWKSYDIQKNDNEIHFKSDKTSLAFKKAADGFVSEIEIKLAIGKKIKLERL